MAAASTERREQVKARIYVLHPDYMNDPILIGPSLDGHGREVRLPADMPEQMRAELVDLACEAFVVGHAEGYVGGADAEADRAEPPKSGEAAPAAEPDVARYTARVEREMAGRRETYQFTAPDIELAVNGLRAISPWPRLPGADPLADDEKGNRP